MGQVALEVTKQFAIPVAEAQFGQHTTLFAFSYTLTLTLRPQALSYWPRLTSRFYNFITLRQFAPQVELRSLQ